MARPIKYNEEMLVQIMRETAGDIGRLSKKDFDNHPNLPCSTTIIRFFGSWANGLEMADLESGKHTGRRPIVKTNYITRHTIMGMLSKNYIPFKNWLGYVKNKNEVVLFIDSDHIISKYFNYPKINLNYIDKLENPKDKIGGYENSSSYFLTNIKSKFDVDFFHLSGKKFTELRETQNKFDKIIEVRNDCDIDQIISFIDKWNESRGKDKYGWQLHSGYDKTFFNNFYKKEQSKLYSNFFFIEGNLVGYSIISKQSNNNEYQYIIRKCDTKYRNLSLYIDLYSFENIFNKIGEFIIDWGASSGGVLKYKKKFPIYSEEKKWFYKFKRTENEQ